MKKTILMLAIAGVISIGNTSCKKEKMPKEAIKQTINVNLKMDENFTFLLPKNLRDDAYEITRQAVHYSFSEVGINASGNRIYQYMPATGYTGTDQVIVSNDEEREMHQTPPKGPHPLRPLKKGCKGPEEEHYIITINFVIENQK